MNQIVVASLEHVQELAQELRVADRAEIAAASGIAPEVALVLSVASSGNSQAWVRNGATVAIFGCAQDFRRSHVGIPWMLATDEATRHPTFLLRKSRELLPQMMGEFAVLENHVDCRNTLAIQWLDWLGFVFTGLDAQYGAQRLPFLTFNLARS